MIGTLEFKIQIGTHIKDNKRDIVITNRECRTNKRGQKCKWYKYTCNKCGYSEGWIVEGNLLNLKQGCSSCYGTTVVEGINDIPTTAPFMIKYFQGGFNEAKMYTKASNKKIYPICSDCGKIKDKSMIIYNIYRRRSIGCTCSDKTSYPNKFAYSLLDQLNEIHKFDYLEHEYSPDWIKPKRYDNYFIHNGKQYILEMDGFFHNNNNLMNGQTKEEARVKDYKKDLKAKEHGIEIIRIECEKSDKDYIKQNIYSSGLNKFYLNKINWSDCEKFALSNLVKVVCDYKKSNTDITTNGIGKAMKLSCNTIRQYLKKGNDLGWCKYNARDELKKIVAKNGKLNGKQVGIFKDGIILRDFSSCYELERKSKELFGVKLFSSNVSSVCVGKLKHYKGFTFKYINEIEQAI